MPCYSHFQNRKQMHQQVQLTTADRPALEAVKGVGAVLADAFVS